MADAAPSESSDAKEAMEMSGNSFAAVLNIEEIKKVLPHRHVPSLCAEAKPYAWGKSGDRCIVSDVCDLLLVASGHT